jgi:hypothetical protein
MTRASLEEEVEVRGGGGGVVEVEEDVEVRGGGGGGVVEEGRSTWQLGHQTIVREDHLAEGGEVAERVREARGDVVV